MKTATSPIPWHYRRSRSVTGCKRARGSLTGHLRTARLKEDCADLLTMAEQLERLASDLYRTHRARDARILADGLRAGLNRHLDAEEALLRTVARPDAELMDDTVERTHAEHLALRKLVVPVIRSLGAIAQDRLPVRLNRFVLEATVLCEFIRLHVNFKCRTLYPLIATLEDRRQAPVT